MATTQPTSLGDLLRHFRLAAGLSQEALDDARALLVFETWRM